MGVETKVTAPEHRNGVAVTGTAFASGKTSESDDQHGFRTQ
jgi:hypothetical protein